MYHDILFESNPQVSILVWIYLHISSHLVLGLDMTLILKIFISDGHIDDNFLEKNLCHSRDSNHRSPVLRTGALTT